MKLLNHTAAALEPCNMRNSNWLLTFTLALMFASSAAFAGYNPIVVGTGAKSAVANSQPAWAGTSITVQQGGTVIGDAKWVTGSDSSESAQYEIRRLTSSATEETVASGTVSTPEGNFDPQTDFTWTASGPGEYHTYSKSTDNPDWVRGPDIRVTAGYTTILTKRCTKQVWQSSGTVIAGGGKSTNVHKADVLVQFNNLPDGNRIEVYLLGGGAGYSDGTWPFNISACPASLTLNGATISRTDASPLVFASPVTLTGVLSSSNLVESTRIVVSIPAYSNVTYSQVTFSAGDVTVSRDNSQDEIPWKIWTQYSVTHMLDDDVISGHEFKIVIGAIRYRNEDGTFRDITATLGDSAETSDSLDEYVELDPAAWFNHEYFAATTQASGLSSQLQVVDPHTSDITLSAYDFSVWQ